MKMRKYGHNKPLVLTGRLKREVLRSRTPRGTSKKASVTMNAPAYIHRSGATEPNKKLELLTLLKYEQDVLGKVLDRAIQRAMDSMNVKTKRRVA
jgi:hypothetical protein